MALVFAVMHLYTVFSFFNASVHSSFILKKKSGTDKSTEWSTIPVCPSPMCFFNQGNTEMTNSSKSFCLMFCMFSVHLCHD